jgi:hypothetical protein
MLRMTFLGFFDFFNSLLKEVEMLYRTRSGKAIKKAEYAF